MENASKALIIAGAILLAILIISLGLLVYNQAKDAATGIGLDEAQISSFNSKFASYEGSNKTGAQVNALIQQVISSNQAEINAGTGKLISMYFKSVSNKNVYIIAYQKNNKIKYSVSNVDNALTSSKLVDDFMKNADQNNATNDFSNFLNQKDTCEASLKVNTGKKYTVTFGYSNGAIDRIGVAEQ